MKRDWSMDFFKLPTPLELAAMELIEAERAKLQAETASEYAQSLVSYNTARIKRLKAYINQATKEQERE